MILNVIPINDTEEHIDSTTCKCKPRVDILENGDIIIVHNSYDGREFIEELIENTNVN